MGFLSSLFSSKPSRVLFGDHYLVPSILVGLAVILGLYGAFGLLLMVLERYRKR